MRQRVNRFSSIVKELMSKIAVILYSKVERENIMFEDKNSIKLLQKEILKIFMVFREICEEHNLRYWAIGGTCIGAVRHNGFIPWDDDLDVVMPDEDYQKLIDIAPKELKWPFELVPAGKLPHSPIIFAKIQNRNTTFIEEIERPFPDSYKGIFIDIFPLCGLPKMKIKRWFLVKKGHILLWFNEYVKRSVTSMRGLLKKALWVGTRCLSVLLPDNYFFNCFSKFIFKRKFDDEKYEWTALWHVHYKKTIYKKSWFSSYVELPFETTTIRCPSEYDKLLTYQFGDYMELPPKDQRKPQHNAFIDLYHPYAFFQAHGLNEA